MATMRYGRTFTVLVVFQFLTMHWCFATPYDDFERAGSSKKKARAEISAQIDAAIHDRVKGPMDLIVGSIERGVRDPREIRKAITQVDKEIADLRREVDTAGYDSLDQAVHRRQLGDFAQRLAKARAILDEAVGHESTTRRGVRRLVRLETGGYGLTCNDGYNRAIFVDENKHFSNYYCAAAVCDTDPRVVAEALCK